MLLTEFLIWMAVLATGGLALYVYWRRPPKPLWPSLFIGYIVAFIWSLGELMTGTIVTTDSAHEAWTAVLYTGVLWMSVVWWHFSRKFTEFIGYPPPAYEKNLRRLLFSVIGFLWLAMLTNPFHGMFIDARLVGPNEFRPLWYVQAVLGYVLVLTVISQYALLWWHEKRETVRRQLLILLAAASVPWIANVIYLSGAVSSLTDPTVPAFTVSMAIFFYGIYRDRLFLLSSITHEHLNHYEQDAELILDRNGLLLKSNPAAKRFFGEPEFAYGEDALTRLSTVLRHPGAKRTRLTRTELGNIIFSPDQPVEGHLFGLSDPQGAWVRVGAIPIPDRRNDIVGVGIRVNDATAFESAKERVAEQAGILEGVLRAMDRGTLVVDSEGHLVYWNELFQEMWEIPNDVLKASGRVKLTNHIMDQIKDAESALKGYMTATDEDRVETGRARILLKDRRTIEVEAHNVRTGSAAGVRVWTFLDVSARIKEEKERRQLEHRFQEAQRLESLGVMAGGIAHDFNNLLMGILGYVELAESRIPEDTKPAEYLARARDAALQASDLTNQMLAYSGKGAFSIETIDMADLLNDTTKLLETVVSKDATIGYDLAKDVHVRGDRAQLRQVFMNLVTNASDALDDRPGLITVVTKVVTMTQPFLSEPLHDQELPAGQYALVEVSDSGEGMAPDTLARIFDPFFTTKFTGRGLGLAAVLGIVRGHQGSLEVTSIQGEGTTFSLLIPECDSEKRSESASRELPQAEPETYLLPGTVLVVEDKNTVREVSKIVLEEAGFKVHTAANGAEGLKAFKRIGDEIDVVLLDMTMPQMDGTQVFTELRTLSKDVSIILSSGYSETEAASAFPADGLQGFIQKPYSRDALVSTIEGAMRKRPTTMSASSEIDQEPKRSA